MTSNKKNTELPWLTDSACSNRAETAGTQNLSVLGGPRSRSYWFYSLVCGLLANVFNSNPAVIIFFMKQEDNLIFCEQRGTSEKEKKKKRSIWQKKKKRKN